MSIIIIETVLLSLTAHIIRLNVCYVPSVYIRIGSVVAEEIKGYRFKFGRATITISNGGILYTHVGSSEIVCRIIYNRNISSCASVGINPRDMLFIWNELIRKSSAFLAPDSAAAHYVTAVTGNDSTSVLCPDKHAARHNSIHIITGTYNVSTVICRNGMVKNYLEGICRVAVSVECSVCITAYIRILKIRGSVSSGIRSCSHIHKLASLHVVFADYLHIGIADVKKDLIYVRIGIGIKMNYSTCRKDRRIGYRRG